MLFNARDSIVSIPASEVSGWVDVINTGIKMESFLITLIVYDAGEYTVRVGHYTNLTFHSKVITLDKEVTR